MAVMLRPKSGVGKGSRVADDDMGLEDHEVRR
jgi:hypothetical protein